MENKKEFLEIVKNNFFNIVKYDIIFNLKIFIDLDNLNFYKKNKFNYNYFYNEYKTRLALYILRNIEYNDSDCFHYVNIFYKNLDDYKMCLEDIKKINFDFIYLKSKKDYLLKTTEKEEKQTKKTNKI